MEAPTSQTVRWSSGSAEVAQDQALYRFLVDSLTEYAVFAVAPTGVIMSWNAGAEKIFGYTRAEMIGRSFAAIFTADDRLAGAPVNELALALSGKQCAHDRWHVRKDATRFWGTNTVEPFFDASAKLIGFTKLVRDTTPGHLALEAVHDSEQQLRRLIESVRDYAIFTIALDGTIETWNSGAERVFGYTPHDAIGTNFSILYSIDDKTAGIPAGQLRRATIGGFADVERWLVRKDGSRFLASGKLHQLERDAAGELPGFVKIAQDVTEHDAIAQDFRRRAQFDELTELPNRRTFYEHVHRAIALMKRRSSNMFAVLFIDLDRFKAVNDEFGHIVADQLLATTARRLEYCVRSEDIVARIGGDEFAILLNGVSGVTDACEAADRIGIAMRQPVTIDERDVRATVSVGIAVGSPTYDRPEDILRDADAAMYAAKTDGRARAAVFDASMASGGAINGDLAADLRHAIERGELRIAYQPILRLRDTTLTGFEALVRWQHPRRGLLAPEYFIPKAEESDLIVSIDRWMLGETARQLADWQARAIVGAELQMSVNISSREFSRDDFLGVLSQIIASSALPPARLRLEITESAVIERSERADSLLAAVRALGVQLDVDDFGTGYSSLGALAHICVDALKIDSSFVSNMMSARGAELVETVISLAHRLGMVAIAEGIETHEQLAQLIALGCDFGQGFLFAQPLDADAAAHFAAEGGYAAA